MGNTALCTTDLSIEKKPNYKRNAKPGEEIPLPGHFHEHFKDFKKKRTHELKTIENDNGKKKKKRERESKVSQKEEDELKDIYDQQYNKSQYQPKF